MIHSRYYGDLSQFREKSWSVRLVEGFIEDNRVRTVQCEDCDSSSKIVVMKYGDSNLVLYGCGNRKCKHILIRMKIDSDAEEPAVLERASEILVESS